MGPAILNRCTYRQQLIDPSCSSSVPLAAFVITSLSFFSVLRSLSALEMFVASISACQQSAEKKVLSWLSTLNMTYEKESFQSWPKSCLDIVVVVLFH